MAEHSPVRRGALFGLGAAVSFGVSAPLAKVMLDDVQPQMLAGLLYLGAFIALTIVRPRTTREASVRRGDVPRLAMMIAAGGVVAPVLLLFGLERVSGVSGSLLLNLEGPFTIFVGVALFREHLPRRSAIGALIVFVGAFLLGLAPGATRLDWIGIVLIAGACACWAIDNNLTQTLMVRDPRVIVWMKAGCAGTVNVVVAVSIGERFPELGVLGPVLALGALSYGLSVYLDARALRELGAAREAAVFAVAPFVGALLAPLVLPETFGLLDLVSGALMVLGVALLVTERHRHRHRHLVLDHDHVHAHDAHHDHEHPTGIEAGVVHSHRHRHHPIVHAHAHVSDVHHRHAH